jgi:hypothetical protein
VSSLQTNILEERLVSIKKVAQAVTTLEEKILKGCIEKIYIRRKHATGYIRWNYFSKGETEIEKNI